MRVFPIVMSESSFSTAEVFAAAGDAVRVDAPARHGPESVDRALQRRKRTRGHTAPGAGPSMQRRRRRERDRERDRERSVSPEPPLLDLGLGFDAPPRPHLPPEAHDEMGDAPVDEFIPLVEHAWPPECKDVVEDRELHPDAPPFCFLCHIVQRQDRAQQVTHYRKLLDYINASFGEVERVLLCTQVQKYYNTALRPHIVENERPWALRTIWAHLTEHQPTPKTRTTMSLQSVTHMMNVLEKGALRSRSRLGDAPDQLDKSNTQLWLQLRREQRQCIKDITAMNQK